MKSLLFAIFHFPAVCRYFFTVPYNEHYDRFIQELLNNKCHWFLECNSLFVTCRGQNYRFFIYPGSPDISCFSIVESYAVDTVTIVSQNTCRPSIISSLRFYVKFVTSAQNMIKESERRDVDLTFINALNRIKSSDFVKVADR